MILRGGAGGLALAQTIDARDVAPDAAARFGGSLEAPRADDRRASLVVHDVAGARAWVFDARAGARLTLTRAESASAPVVDDLVTESALTPPHDPGAWSDAATLTPLQKHVEFFDANHDGYITVPETYAGLRALGLDPVSSATFAAVINGALATPTRGFPSLTIDVANIADTKHGSDTDVYDYDGNFDESKFDALFAKWDTNHDGALDLGELVRSRIGQADLYDFFGVVASGGEFGLLWVVANQNGKISEARMRGLYDGSLFYQIAADRAAHHP